MSPTSQVHQLAPPRRRRCPEQTYDVRLAGDETLALVRLLSALRRRGCVVLRVDYRAPDTHGPGWLTVVLEPPASHAHAVVAWLGNLVDVVELRARR